MIYLVLSFFFLSGVAVFDVLRWHKGYNLCLFIFLVILILLSGLRYKIGGDTLVYMEEYELLPTFEELSTFDISQTRYDYLWVVFCSFCKIFSEDYLFMQFVQAVVINAVYFYYIYKNTPFRFTGVFLYFILGFLYINTEIMREAMAIAVFLLIIQLYYNKKWVGYYAFCIIAFFIHSSALLLFFLPFISRVKINNQFFYSIIILSTLSTILWQQLNEYIEFLSIVLAIKNKTDSYFNNTDFVPNFNGLLFGVLMYVLLPLFFIFMVKIKDRNTVKEAPYLWFYVVLGIFTIFNSTVFTRFQNYFFFPFIVFLSKLIFQYNYKNVIHLLKIASLFTLLLISKYFSYFKYEPHGGSYMYQRYFPYESVFTKKNIPYRN